MEKAKNVGVLKKSGVTGIRKQKVRDEGRTNQTMRSVEKRGDNSGGGTEGAETVLIIKKL